VIKVWTDLNTALFSSSFRLTELIAIAKETKHKNIQQSSICGITETVSHFLLDCPRHTTLRQQLFYSLLDIPETISLNLLIFGSVNLNDEENRAVFKSVQTFITKSKRFTP
jgi:hypothetical protein